MLDKNFIKSLHPPIADLLPHGAYTQIAKQVGKTPLTVRNALHGASTNEPAVREAIKSLIQLGEEIQQLLNQVPQTVITELRQEVNQHK